MDNVTVAYLFVFIYLVLNVIVGILGLRFGERTPDDYFLAGRKVGPFVLFFTLIATNFSAFFFLGFAGAGYRIGYSYYGMMAFGTALVALSFYFFGYKIWVIGKKAHYITPPEFIGDRFQSKPLKAIFLTVMVIFTIPYLAIQPIGAGYLLSSITEGAIPYFSGAVILTVFIVFYVFMGGMRTVAWTDVLQGILMFILMAAAVIVIGNSLGGQSHANETAFKIEPELFSRSGVNGYFSPAKWFSFVLLWLLCVPMFPQMFMRFFISKSVKSLQVSAIAYPIVTAILFICPVTIGVWGHISFPNLGGTESDQILPMMLAQFTPAWFAALVMIGALAAFMSTMDSQLLALSSMLTRDFYMGFFNKKATMQKQVFAGRVLILILAIVGLMIAYKPPATIFKIATQTFTGLAVLFPTTVAALYIKNANAWSCIASIVVGELLLLGFYFEIIPPAFRFGFLPVIPIVFISFAIVLIGSKIKSLKRNEIRTNR